eukprot:CAMPEP_0184345136 /NCGR_PEP_ID=MMETSP1089-20130417/13582_1 /TAXON_ID=38269 ORGANISM="Gloeochaete wittrockiana, Strain SAG46.84" /NCGR_SAMPLE_ID=MMETSP1089 /ASSEMBLY_ACC=CAM_ASM_000445 /LENGTH=97 /DNA_ID=CAMNT_0026675317 /DNA_START=110 /DNA_END=404 /DNA_ORIENTATION=-
MISEEHEVERRRSGKDTNDTQEDGEDGGKHEKPDDGPEGGPDEGEDAGDDETECPGVIGAVEGGDVIGVETAQHDDGDDAMHNRPRKEPPDDGVDVV